MAWMPEPVGLLFVCLGNICRSPMAEAVMLAKISAAGLEDRFFVDSAGLGDWHVGEAPDLRTVQVLRKRGMKPASRGRQLSSYDFDRFDYILAMDDQNVEGLRRWPGSNMSKVSLLLSWDASASRRDVPDPYYGDMSDFEFVYALVDSACEALLAGLAAA